MKLPHLVLISIAITSLHFTTYSQSTTCAAAAAGTPIADGSCLTNQNSTTGVPAVNCGGGFNSGTGFFYSFVAGTCPQFDVTATADNEYQFILWSSACGLISAECSENTANVPFTFSDVNLTPGTTYVLEVVWDNNATFDICYEANVAEDPSNECAGALGLGNSPTTFYNGGNCAFTGSINDPTTSDPAAGLLCAGSLENTQWIQFSPIAGATSFDIIGTNISCSGGACAWQFGIASGNCSSLTWEGCVSDGNACVNGPDPSQALTGSTADGFALSWSGVSGTGFTGTVTPTGGGTFTGTETFYLVMDGNANADCNYTLSGLNLQPLPIELISFYAKKFNNVNRIYWEVASETNNDYFTIERSTELGVWEEVGMINGAGTSSEQRLYAFTDDRYQKNTNYYRIKQTDFNGDYEYSKIISVDNSIKTKKLISVVNSMGQVVETDASGLKIFVYEDGSTEKKY